MIEKIANTNGYKWVQKCTLCGNYIIPSINMVTCLILPRMGSSATNFQEGSQKEIVVVVPPLSCNIEISNNIKKKWLLRYELKGKVTQITIVGPSEIINIWSNSYKQFVRIKIYNNKKDYEKTQM